MRTFTTHFVNLSSIICSTAILYSLFMVGVYGQKDSAASMDFYPWVGLALVFYIINMLVLRRGISESLFTGMNVCFIALLTVGGSIFLVHEPATFMARIAAGVFLLVPAVQAFVLSRKPLSPNNMLNLLEGAIILFALHIFIQEGGNQQYFNLPLTLALILSFISVILMRTVSGNRSKVQGNRLAGALVMVGIFVLVIVVALGGLLVVSKGVQTLFGGLLSGVSSIKEFFSRLADKFAEFLSRFASDEPMESPEMEPPSGPATDGGMDAFGQMDWGNFPIIAICVIAAVLVIGVLIWMVKNKGKKIPSEKLKIKDHEEKRTVVRNRFGERIVQWIRALQQKIIFRWHRVVYRNTAPGILLRAEDMGRRKKLRRNQGESGSHYVLRLFGTLEEKNLQPGDRELVESLAGTLDRFFYGKGDGKLPEKDLGRLKRIFL